MEEKAVSQIKNFYLLKIIVFFISAVVFLFPLFFSSLTTEAFLLPKQILLISITILLLVLCGGLILSEQHIQIRRTPFDLALLILGIVVLLSSLYSPNKYDSLLASIPFLFLIVFFYITTNTAKHLGSFNTVTTAFILGSTLSSLLVILSFFKIYLLPFPYTKFPQFTTFGSLLDQAVYFSIVVITASYFAYLYMTQKTERKSYDAKGPAYATAAIINLCGLIVTLYFLFTTHKPLLLPFETGFQTAFAAISQDTGRILQGFLFGSGFGTYLTDFTKFKLASFNNHEAIWNMLFARSSSFVLELLATVGFIGTAVFVFLIFKIVKNVLSLLQNPFAYALLILSFAAFVIPFTYTLQFLLILLIALFSGYAAFLKNTKSHTFYDVDLRFVAFEKGFLALSVPSHSSKHIDLKSERNPKMVAATFFILFLLISIVSGFYLYRFVASDVMFQNSTKRTGETSALDIYNDRTSAIRIFPWRDGYHRVYAQTNLAIASSIASNLESAKATPSAQQQQLILQSLQQAVNSSRNAIYLSPRTGANYENLSGILRSLIPIQKDAARYAVEAAEQAVILNPNNPDGYINTGSILFQLKEYDLAQRQFQIAVNLKPNYARARYTLGNALEARGDFQEALNQYLIVQNLVANNKEASEKIAQDIAALKEKAGQLETTAPQQPSKPNDNTTDDDLSVSSPSANLPSQLPPVKLSPPPSATGSAR